MLEQLRNVSAVVVFDYVEDFTYLFIFTTYWAALFLLSRAASYVPQYVICSASPHSSPTNFLHLHNPNFSLLSWGWGGGGSTGEHSPVKVIPSTQITSFGCTSKCHLLYVFIALDITNQQKELSHDYRWHNKQIQRPKYKYTNTYFQESDDSHYTYNFQPDSLAQTARHCQVPELKKGEQKTNKQKQGKN